MYDKLPEAQTLVGLTINSITHKPGDDRIELEMTNGKRYAWMHHQDCCESVNVHDVQGDLQSLVGKPITRAVKDESPEWPADVPKPDHTDSFTWTTLYIETETAKVRVRWLGESNGYYGETVDLEDLN